MPDPTRVRALSIELARTHDRLRHRLDDLRQAVAESNLPENPFDPRDHCLAMCAAVGRHHTGEDEGMLPALRDADPRLAPTVDKLIEDHRAVAGLLTRVRELLDDRGLRPQVLLGELDGLAAILGSHFAYEERAISTALDELPSGEVDDWRPIVLTPESASTPAG